MSRGRQGSPSDVWSYAGKRVVIISGHNAVLGLAMVGAGALTASAGPRWVYVFASALLALGGATAFALFRSAPAPVAVREGT